MPTVWPYPQFTLTATLGTDVYFPEVTSTSTRELKFVVPEFVANNNQKLTVRITDPTGASKSFTVNLVNSATTQISLRNTSQFTAGSQAIQISQNSFTELEPLEISVFNSLNEKDSTLIADWTRSGNNITFNHYFTAGKWGFKIRYPNGYARTQGFARVIHNFLPTAENLEISFAGGLVNVLSGEINSEAILNVNGTSGKLLRHQTGLSVFEAPALLRSVDFGLNLGVAPQNQPL